MQQVLFRIPPDDGMPVPGFGMMLFIVFVVTTWLAGRRAEREGMPREKIQDFVLWTFIGGMVGARIFYVVQYWDTLKNPVIEFFQIWNGGIVFYGSAIGGWLAGLIAHRIFLKRYNVSAWKLADAVAPSVAIGLCLGRIGCFLNGCCYGHIAAPDCAAAHFPLQTAPARELVVSYQTAAGFAMDPHATDSRTVGAIEPNSAAAATGLEPGDIIVAVDGKPIENYGKLADALTYDWPRGKKDVALTVRRDGNEVTLSPFIPRTIGLVPTQIYESITMFLIFLVLLALYPVRKYDGQLMVVLMLCYAVHRFINESLRHDTPTYWYALTISQWISVGIFTAGVVLHVWRRRYPIQVAAPKAIAKKPLAQLA